MRIKYVHFSEPNKEKIYDTVKSLKNNPFIKKTQEEFDQFELEKMRKDKERGHILSYEVLEEEDT